MKSSSCSVKLSLQRMLPFMKRSVEWLPTALDGPLMTRLSARLSLTIVQARCHTIPLCQKLHENTVAWKSTKAGCDRICIQMAGRDGWLGANPVLEHCGREVEGVTYPWGWRWKMECHSKVNGKEHYRWWIRYDDKRFAWWWWDCNVRVSKWDKGSEEPWAWRCRVAGCRHCDINRNVEVCQVLW